MAKYQKSEKKRKEDKNNFERMGIQRPRLNYLIAIMIISTIVVSNRKWTAKYISKLKGALYKSKPNTFFFENHKFDKRIPVRYFSNF